MQEHDEHQSAEKLRKRLEQMPKGSMTQVSEDTWRDDNGGYWEPTITGWVPAIPPDAPRASPDPVNHPAHYQSECGMECWEAQLAAVGVDGYVAHCRATAIKYCWRSGKKLEHAEDLRKAAWYLKKAADVMDKCNGEKEPPTTPTSTDDLKFRNGCASIKI